MWSTNICFHRVGSNARAIFDLNDSTARNRNAIVGISSITILLDADTSHATFVVHQRGHYVDEAVGLKHVAPAGTFQPTIPREIDQRAGLKHRDWQKSFSVRENVVREFAEECKDLDRAISHAANSGHDWREQSAASETYKKLTTALKDPKGTKARLFYFGLGFDPLTEKPQLLTALVMRKSFATDLGLTPSTIFNEEGRGNIEHPFTATHIEGLIDADDWLGDGLACLRLAVKHQKFLVSSLDAREHTEKPSAGNRKMRKGF
jgi:hypothetical protein